MRTNDNLIGIPTIKPILKCKLRLSRLERLKDWLLLEEEYLRIASLNKKRDVKLAKREKILNKLRGSPMVAGKLIELLDDNRAIVGIGSGEVEMLVPILSFVDRSRLKLNSTVLMNQHNFSVVGVIEDQISKEVLAMRLSKPPVQTYSDIGGLSKQIEEIREAIELPLSHPELFDEMGIKPPKGIILYGPSGTGKTLLARAVAHSTSATFFHCVGSELVNKTLGAGAKLVRDIFKLAEENAPSIVFIDEIDAIGFRRQNRNSEGEREVQRTMLELLNQLDGFDSRKDIKIILATNNIESLDTALIRPGRIDRKIEIPLPDEQGRRKIFELHTAKMRKADDIDIDEIIHDHELSGADIASICTEAGFQALRNRRLKANNEDFRRAKEIVCSKKVSKKLNSINK